MQLAALLLELKPLLAEPAKHLPRITRLLDEHKELAEYEVARFFAAQTLLPGIEESARSLDPRERRRALDSVAAVLPRALAAKVVRHLVKDPDIKVRRAASDAVAGLGLWHETALRDSRYSPPKIVGPFSPGAFNTTGWQFGVRRPKPPKRAPAKATPRRIENPAALAKLLGVGSAEELVRFTRPGTRTGAPYVAFEVPKRSGGTRTLHAPRPALKRIQRIILKEILNPLPTNAACHGFVRGRSTATNAGEHVGSALVLKLDLRDFFPSVHYRRVLGLFMQLGYSHDVAELLAQLTTHRPVLADGTVVWPGVLPQGAPTSPAIANQVCRRLDQRLGGLAHRVGATYTRYADDLSFSFARPPEAELGRFFWWVDQICQQEGFAEHPGKRRVLGQAGRRMITGLVVNQKLTIPRDQRQRFRAILHNCRKHGVESQAKGRADFAAYLRGFAAYVSMVQPKLGARWRKEVEEVLKATKGEGS